MNNTQNIINELRNWLTHGHEGASWDHARLNEIAGVLGKHGNTVKNLVKGKTRRPDPVMLDRIVRFLSMQG